MLSSQYIQRLLPVAICSSDRRTSANAAFGFLFHLASASALGSAAANTFCVDLLSDLVVLGVNAVLVIFRINVQPQTLLSVYARQALRYRRSAIF